MGVLDIPPGVDLLRPSEPAKDIIADDAEMLALAPDLPFHGIRNIGTGFLYARDGLNTIMVKFGHGGLFVKRSAPISFHHPQIRISGLDESEAFIDIATIQAIHGEYNGKQQAYPDNRGDKPDFMKLQVIDC